MEDTKSPLWETPASGGGRAAFTGTHRSETLISPLWNNPETFRDIFRRVSGPVSVGSGGRSLHTENAAFEGVGVRVLGGQTPFDREPQQGGC